MKFLLSWNQYLYRFFVANLFLAVVFLLAVILLSVNVSLLGSFFFVSALLIWPLINLYFYFGLLINYSKKESMRVAVFGWMLMVIFLFVVCQYYDNLFVGGISEESQQVIFSPKAGVLMND